MANKSLAQKLVAISPHVEMVVRKMYWDNVRWFESCRNKQKKKRLRKNQSQADLKTILDYLARNGVGPGTLIVVHSAYSELKHTGKTPLEIVNALRDLIGPEGTLAMPAIRRYPEDPGIVDFIQKDMSSVTVTYNLRTSKVWTGVLPQALLSFPDAKVSRFPLNSMVAIGRLAAPMMARNLEGEKPLPHGINSSWNFCATNNALVLGLGVDLTHSLTMIHVAEDVKDKDWSVKDWYRDRRFNIIDGDFGATVVVRERKPKWGTYKFAERTLCKDLVQNGILRSTEIDGVIVEMLRAPDLLNFLNSKNDSGYPYFWV